MSNPQPVTISERNGHLVITVMTSTIGPRESVDIVAAAADAIANGDRRGKCMVIDLSRVNLLPSMGLGTCIDLHNRAVDRGMQPVVSGLNSHLSDLFKLMRVDRLFRTAASAAELERMLA
jgi:anti-anti-sigma regulatory factor